MLTWRHSAPQDGFSAPVPEISNEGGFSMTATSSESQTIQKSGTFEPGEELYTGSSNTIPTHPTTLSANPSVL